MKQEASFSLDVGLILPWSERHDAFLLAQLSQTWNVGSCLHLQVCWSRLLGYTLGLLAQVHTVPSPHFPLPLPPTLTDEQSPSEPVQGTQLVDSWHSIHPSYFLLCLLHPKKAQMLQLLQGRIGSQQGRLRAI